MAVGSNLTNTYNANYAALSGAMNTNGWGAESFDTNTGTSPIYNQFNPILLGLTPANHHFEKGQGDSTSFSISPIIPGGGAGAIHYAWYVNNSLALSGASENAYAYTVPMGASVGTSYTIRVEALKAGLTNAPRIKHSWKITATDTLFAPRFDSNADYNPDPNLTNPTNSIMVTETSSISFFVNASDPDGDTIQYAADCVPSGASFNTSTREFSWTPGYDAITRSAVTSNVYVRFKLRDVDGSNNAINDYPTGLNAGDCSATTGFGTSTQVSFVTIQVKNVNRSLSITGPGDQTGAENSNINFTVQVGDPDADDVPVASCTNLNAAAIAGNICSSYFAT